MFINLIKIYITYLLLFSTYEIILYDISLNQENKSVTYRYVVDTLSKQTGLKVIVDKNIQHYTSEISIKSNISIDEVLSLLIENKSKEIEFFKVKDVYLKGIYYDKYIYVIGRRKSLL